MPAKPPMFRLRPRDRSVDDRMYAARRRCEFEEARIAALHSGHKWRELRNRHLKHEPLCRACVAAGVPQLAKVVDHVEPVREQPERAYDDTNLQSLCARHHAVKSAAERKRWRQERAAAGSRDARGVGGRGNSVQERAAARVPSNGKTHGFPENARPWGPSPDSCGLDRGHSGTAAGGGTR